MILFLTILESLMIHNDSDRDYWMTSTEAKDYGMIDEVLEKKK